MLKKLIQINHRNGRRRAYVTLIDKAQTKHHHDEQQQEDDRRYMDEKIREAVINIPSHSKVLIGGFSTRLVPESLIEILTTSSKKSKNLTVLSNACAKQIPSLRSLLIDSGKVDRFVTTLESNAAELAGKSNSPRVELLDTIEFTRLCSTGGVGDYALVRSNLMDTNGCHYWIGPSSVNLVMAKWAKRFAVAQFDRLGEINVKDTLKLDGIFVPLSCQFDQDNTRYDDKFADDLFEIDSMLKRTLLELNNNDVVFFSTRVTFYFNIYIKILIQNTCISIQGRDTNTEILLTEAHKHQSN